MFYMRNLFILFGIFISLLEGIWAETQRFREVPKSVLVSENDDVELRCAVEHQKGKAQWTKDGFALGFERDVPGYPRYQYSGDTTRGEHHLVISGVTLQDDGEYQCQVGPTNEAPPIWAAANVTVLVAPSSIDIVDWGDGAVVEVVSGSSLALECLVSDARPAPSLTWYRDGIELDFSKQRDATEKGSRPRLMSLRSRLHIKAVPADDGQQFSCKGRHPALDRQPSSLVASITLSVLHPPEPPIISGYNEDDILISGQKVSLTCTSQGGNPRPWVFWYRDETLIDDTTTTDGKMVINTMELTVTSSEDGATFYCKVTSDMLDEPLATQIRLSVHYPPSSVSITGPKSIALGDELSLQCKTSPSNPESIIKWVIQGKEIKTDSSSAVKDSSGGWVTTSNVSGYKVTSFKVREGSHIEAECQAINPELKEIVTENHIVSLVKPAGPPVLEGLDGEIVEGASLPFSCQSKGGNPPPTLTLYKGGELLTSEVRQTEKGTKVIAEIKVMSKDNGQEVTCQVDHPATKQPRTVTRRLAVFFPPSKIIGKASPTSVEEGNHVTLSCETSSSNPASNITWYSEGSILKGASQHLTDGEFRAKRTRSELVIRASAKDDARIFNCEASNGLLPIASTNITISVNHAPIWIVKPPDQVDVYEDDDLVVSVTAAANPGPLRYWWRRGQNTLPSTGGQLRFTKIRREEEGNFSVSAYSQRGAVNASFYINVQYPPERMTAANRVTVAEGGTATIECSAEGNPKPKIIWSKENRGEALATAIQTSKLLIENASRNDTGIYVCSASNGVGNPVTLETSVVIKHGAMIVRDNVGARGTWAIEGGKGLLSCHARAAPTPTFHWSSQEGESIQNSAKHKIQEPQFVDGLTLWVSTLEIVDVNSGDYADYRCTASNTLGADTALLTLKPPNKPHPPSDLKLINKTYSTITLSWTASNLEGGPIHNYIIRYRDEEEAKYQEIKSLPHETFQTLHGLTSGKTYIITVYARNDKGASSPIEPPLLITLPEQIGGMTSISSSTFGSTLRNSKGVTIGGWRVPRLVLLITTLTGATLLVLNIAIIACFVRRRSNSRNVSGSSSKTTTLGGTGVASVTSGSNLENNDEGESSDNRSSSLSPQIPNAKGIRNEKDSPTSESHNQNNHLTPPPNGHLPRKNSVSASSLSIQKQNVENHSELPQNESSYSVDLLQGSVSPEGRRAAAVNPEVCSLASSTYEYQCKRPPISGSSLDDPKICSSDDQLSVTSYQSGHSRTYSHSHTRTPNIPPTLTNRNIQETTRHLHPHPHVVYQNKVNTDQQIQNVQIKAKHNQESNQQYASLNAANLCELNVKYYDGRSCNGHDPRVCRCNRSGSASVSGFATLGNRNRRQKAPQFATLQRHRPSQIRFQSCSFDSQIPIRCSSGCSSGCQCSNKMIYPKMSPYSPQQPCSLPTCLTTLPQDSKINDLINPHPSSHSDADIYSKDLVNTENINVKNIETFKNNNSRNSEKEQISTLRRKHDPNPAAGVNSHESTFKEYSPKPLRAHSTTVQSGFGNESSLNRLPSSVSESNRLSPICFQNSTLQGQSNNSGIELYSLGEQAANSSNSSINSIVSVNRPKFPQDYVKQVNGSTKDVTNHGTIKASSKKLVPVSLDNIDSSR